MKWKDFINNKNQSWQIQGLVKTDIECPECGRNIYKRTDVVLSCLPPKYEYKCLECGWSDYA